MKNLFCLLSISLFLFACSGGKQQIQQVLQQKQVDKLLTENNIFQYDSVNASLAKVTKDQMTKGRQVFMQGLDFYINKKNIEESIKLFRESALYYPNKKTYNYLANAYVDIGDPIQAERAVNMFMEIDDYEASYTMARIYAIKKDTASAINNLASAFSFGFANKKRLENDKCFDYLRGEKGFVSLLITYIKDEDKLRSMLFKSFLASFPDSKFPMEMSKDTICAGNQNMWNSPTSIGYDYAPFIKGMEDGRFSRDVSNEYLMVSKFKVANGICAVIYKTVMVIVDTLPPVDLKIATYDSLGNFLDEKLFAQYTLPDNLLTGKVDENGIISLKEFTMKWKKNPLEEGYADNEYLGEDLKTETKFQIGPDGKFILYSDKTKTDVVKK